uniref:Uncharacterized protein n=1 Tax=Caenorhabditis japonica TaxID=281687 RepID=A0A8R1HV94_CAEJA
MLSPEQNSVVQLVVTNMPEPIRLSPAILDVADESMSHIMGGDPLESLRIKSIRSVLENVAEANPESWQEYLKNQPLDNFANCFLNQSPEIMLSLFDHCEWAPSTHQKEAKMTVRSNHIQLEVNKKQYLNVQLSESFSIPKWIPYFLKNLCKESISHIDIQFEGEFNAANELRAYKDKFLAANKNVNYSRRGAYIYEPRALKYHYCSIQGTLCFSGHSKRRAGTTVFAKFHRRPCSTDRDVNLIMTKDLTC